MTGLHAAVHSGRAQREARIDSASVFRNALGHT
jgi:hypothetical protein